MGSHALLHQQLSASRILGQPQRELQQAQHGLQGPLACPHVLQRTACLSELLTAMGSLFWVQTMLNALDVEAP